jgi:hypothetical protein
MPGLCDYRDKVATFNLVEYTFDIDVRRWQRREFLTPNTTFLTLWRTDDRKCCSLRVRVISEDQVRLIYSLRMPGRRWQRKEQPIEIVWDSCRYGGRQRTLRVHLLSSASAVQPRRRLFGAKPRPSSVHSADSWEEPLLPEIERQQARGKEVVFRSDAAFAKPE